jgi:hypothetical protein
MAGVAIALAFCAVAPTVSTAVSHPACFGAASRNPVHPCRNPKLERMVVPTPSDALIEPNSPCRPVQAPISVCAIGGSAAKPNRTVALVGDSHAAHWRAALGVAAHRLGWSALSVTHGSCPFTQGVSVAPEPKRTECIDWNQGVLDWFRAHPEVSTMLISDHPGHVIRKPGQSNMQAWVAGITAGWAALPATVEHIIVIRDVPFIDPGTLPCIDRAIAKRRDAGRACAVPVRRALHRDPDVVAAKQVHSRRVQIVDMTHFFCDSRRCYPVVGGALVFFDDFDHITRAFGTTLGPFLGSRIKGLMASW